MVYSPSFVLSVFAVAWLRFAEADIDAKAGANGAKAFLDATGLGNVLTAGVNKVENNGEKPAETMEGDKAILKAVKFAQTTKKFADIGNSVGGVGGAVAGAVVGAVWAATGADEIVAGIEQDIKDGKVDKWTGERKRIWIARPAPNASGSCSKVSEHCLKMGTGCANYGPGQVAFDGKRYWKALKNTCDARGRCHSVGADYAPGFWEEVRDCDAHPMWWCNSNSDCSETQMCGAAEKVDGYNGDAQKCVDVCKKGIPDAGYVQCAIHGSCEAVGVHHLAKCVCDSGYIPYGKNGAADLEGCILPEMKEILDKKSQLQVFNDNTQTTCDFNPHGNLDEQLRTVGKVLYYKEKFMKAFKNPHGMLPERCAGEDQGECPWHEVLQCGDNDFGEEAERAGCESSNDCRSNEVCRKDYDRCEELYCEDDCTDGASCQFAGHKASCKCKVNFKEVKVNGRMTCVDDPCTRVHEYQPRFLYGTNAEAKYGGLIWKANRPVTTPPSAIKNGAWIATHRCFGGVAQEIVGDYDVCTSFLDRRDSYTHWLHALDRMKKSQPQGAFGFDNYPSGDNADDRNADYAHLHGHKDNAEGMCEMFLGCIYDCHDKVCTNAFRVPDRPCKVRRRMLF